MLLEVPRSPLARKEVRHDKNATRSTTCCRRCRAKLRQSRWFDRAATPLVAEDALAVVLEGPELITVKIVVRNLSIAPELPEHRLTGREDALLGTLRLGPAARVVKKRKTGTGWSRR